MGQKFIILLGIFVCLILSGCQKDNSGDDTKPTEQPSPTITEEGENKMDNSADNEQTKDEAVSDILVPDILVPEILIKAYELPDSPALSFVQDMKIGWNLGNTLDAVNNNLKIEKELSIESAWCGVITTKEMIDEIKNSGFNTVRIPVSWHNHLLDDEFTISPVWMNRVKEIIDYVIDNDMYAIINIHHDIDEKYYYPTKEHLNTSTKYMTSIWTQVSEVFKDYSHNLIFESINEPRLTGTSNEWYLDMNKEICKEAAECINELNQVFVDIVRNSGGNNTERYLLVPGYAASPENAVIDAFHIPSDTAENENRIIVSVHAYTPYSFALQASEEKGSTSLFKADKVQHTKDIDNFMDKLYDKFTSKGTAVIIGEFGSRYKDNNYQDRVDHATYYIAAAKARGMICCWWDNNAFTGTGELFGLFRRRALLYAFPEILNGLMKGLESIEY